MNQSPRRCSKGFKTDSKRPVTDTRHSVNVVSFEYLEPEFVRQKFHAGALFRVEPAKSVRKKLRRVHA